MSKRDNMVECQICGTFHHSIQKHLKEDHVDWTVERYSDVYPDAKLISDKLQAALDARREEKKGMAQMVAKIVKPSAGKSDKVPLHEVFGMPLTDEMRSVPRQGQSQGDPIMCLVFDRDSLDEASIEAIPEVDEDYVFSEEELKDAVMAIQIGEPLLAWGLHGTGKTSLIEQICARTNRPWIRVQHTGTTEESHIYGQMAVRDGGTHFDYGPLAEAMMRGWAYVADEYDYAHPDVIAVYQPVLEGKPLYIKEAPPLQRVIKPHPNFRFIATANTNGSGDDTGLYSGTKMGNAAAYSRFGVTIQVNYPKPEAEASILVQRLRLTKDLAEKMVEFANSSREMYRKGELSLPISPRELIKAGKLALLKGGKFNRGIALAYSNRLDETQAESVSQAAQRIFG